MRRALPLAMALALGACGGSNRSTPPSPPADPPPAVAALRCTLGEGVAPTPANEAIRDSLPWIANGPRGLRLVAQAHRFDGNFESFGLYLDDPTAPVVRDIGLGTPGSIAWTGAVHLAIARDRLLRFDAAFSRELGARMTFPVGACHASLTEGRRGALAVWGRAQGERGCFESTAWMQAFDESGVARGPAVPVPVPAGTLAPVVRWVRARWDFGRYVVTAEFAQSGLWSWVLDPEGRVLGDRADAVACPRVGCVAVTAEQTSGEEGDGSTTVLRVRGVAGDLEGFATSASAREVRGLVASGDRVLVLHDTPDRTGCGLTVVDVARRSTVVQLRDDAMACAEAHVRARPRGFVLAEREPQRGPVTRAIDCTD
ncbi:MAG: hypothetical protein U0325_21475 [Polyangiales bacterium]